MPIAFLIPARYGSSRLPGKPLIHIAGAEAICWPFQACGRVAGENDLVRVVTDSAQIAQAVGPQNAIMVTQDVANGTERCALALDQIPDEYQDICIIAGDQTTIEPWFIADLVHHYLQRRGIWTLLTEDKRYAVTTADADDSGLKALTRGSAYGYGALGCYLY